MLPHGPIQQHAYQPDLVDELYTTTHDHYAKCPTTRQPSSWTSWGIDQDTQARVTSWDAGPTFIWRNAACPKASDRVKSNPVSRAWQRTVAWLRELQASRTTNVTSAAKWKLLFYEHPLEVDDPFLQADAAAFRAWARMVTAEALSNPTWVATFVTVAAREADHASARAARLAAAKFEDWLHEGPAQGLKRQHLFSRVATGWIPSKCGSHTATTMSELDDVEGLSLEQSQTALAPTPEASTPFGAQTARQR